MPLLRTLDITPRQLVAANGGTIHILVELDPDIIVALNQDEDDIEVSARIRTNTGTIQAAPVPVALACTSEKGRWYSGSIAIGAAQLPAGGYVVEAYVADDIEDVDVDVDGDGDEDSSLDANDIEGVRQLFALT